ncbi:hypothetical protein LF1_23330 [Rubripirellula obstinata]|uniref:Uncharacterized protein n=1 Tax=Rubripirellula obstinata TaxID=406547 RepID=A0A5B1CGW3_9BACT|nr:hypothetical protein LF1_23330 [Rubripirellula obstinata]
MSAAGVRGKPQRREEFLSSKNPLFCLAAWASPRAFRPAWTRGAMPTRLNSLETLHGVGETTPKPIENEIVQQVVGEFRYPKIEVTRNTSCPRQLNLRLGGSGSRVDFRRPPRSRNS